MSALRLYAVSRSALAACRGTGGDPARLRATAAERFGFGRLRGPSLVGRLGPLTRRPLPVDDAADLPTRADVETLLSGSSPTPDRLAACWQLLGCWLDVQASARLVLDVDAAGVAALDAELLRRDARPPWTIGAALRSPAPLRLPPLPGMTVGYADPPSSHPSAPFAPVGAGTVDQLQRWFGDATADPSCGLLAILTRDAR